MALLRLFLPWITGGFIVLFFEWALRSHAALAWLPAVSIAAVVIGVRSVSRPTSRGEMVNLLAVVGIYMTTAWMVFFFIPLGVMTHFIAVVSGVLIMLYCLATLYFYYLPHKYQAFTLDNTITYVGMLSIFFLSSTLSGLTIFLPQPRWMMTILFTLGAGALAYLVLWANNVWDRAGLPIAGGVALLVGEWFAVQSMWPTSVFVSGFCTALLFYAVMGVLRSSYREKLDRAAIVRYASVFTAALAIVLLTARWR